MKKNSLGVMFLLLALAALAACQPGPASATAASAAPSGTNPASERQFQASLPMKLAAGTLKLEGTDQAVTVEQAQALLPLWKAVKSLSSSETITQAEIDALYQQIEEGMTAEQMQAIDALNLDQSEMAALMEQFGVEGFGGNGAPQDMPQGTPRARNGGEFPGGSFPEGGFQGGRAPGGGQGGQIPEGGFQGGGFQGDFGRSAQGTPNPEMATAIAGRASRMNQFNPFTDAVIELLQERSGE